MLTHAIVPAPPPVELREPGGREVLIKSTRWGRLVHALVLLGGEQVGTTPFYLRSPPGLFLVTLRIPGLPAVKVEVFVSEERGHSVEVALDLHGLH